MIKKSGQTIEDIARLAGVSKSTVSRTLNDSPLISDETKELIRAIAQEHKFQIHLPARRLSMKESRTIAFVMHAYHKEFSVDDMFVMEILGSISKALSQESCDLLIVYVDPYETEWSYTFVNLPCSLFLVAGQVCSWTQNLYNENIAASIVVWD